MAPSHSVPARNLLSAVLHGLPVQLGVLDRELRFVGAQDLGLPMGQAQVIPPGSNFAALYGDVPEVADGVRRAFAGKEVRINFEREGSAHALTLVPDFTAAGEVGSVIVVVAPLHQPETLELALAEARARERRMFQSSMMGLFYWQEDGQVSDANDTMLGLLGYTRDELVRTPLNWVTLTPPEYHELDQRALEEIRASGACRPFEKEYLHKNGERIPVLVGGSSWTRGRLAGVAFVVDLSEHKRRQRNFLTTESRLQRVVDIAPIVLWAVDANGLFTLSTGRGLEELGLKPDQVLGQSAFEIYADVPQIVESIRRALEGEDVEETLDVGSRAFHSRVAPIYGDGDKVEGVFGVSFDVTERRRAEQQQALLEVQLLEVQKLESLGLLAGGIAHDFNNILTVIMGGASMVRMALPPESAARTEIESVITAAERAAGLTHQMLAYAGKARVEVLRIDLSAHVREIAALLETTMSKKVELRLELDPKLPPIEADVAQVQQVAMNLVINSADAIGDCAGRIVVTTGMAHLDANEAQTLFKGQPLSKHGYVFLEVTDTGHGMDEATKARIFDPFFTTKFTGRGLGLAAVRGIIKAHHGAIHVESSPGTGTRFRVLFPAVDGAIAAALPATPLDFRGEGLALVIDDDDAVRKLTSRILKRLGFAVQEAPNGRAGAELFRQHARDFAVVLVDMTMPEMNGEETFAALRSIRADIPILLVSGYDHPESATALTPERPTAFLRKPFSSADLAGKLGLVLAAGSRGRAPS